MPSVNDKRAIYKAQCVPLEFPADSNAKRWFLDSDCGKKMANEWVTDEFSNGVYNGTATSNGKLLDNANYYEFVCLKNNADVGVLMNVGGSNAFTYMENLINPGEIMVFEPIGVAKSIASIRIYALSGVPKVEYYIGYKNS